MEKIITIGSKEVRLNNNIGWAMIYRDQFNRDIIPALMPVLAGVLDVVSGIINETGKINNLEMEDILAVFNGDALLDAVVHLSGLEFVDLLNIIWALAKNADETIEEPRRWVKQFDEFPLDEIAPEVGELIVKGVISSKNLERLRGISERLKLTQPSNSIQSFSLDSNEA